MTRRLFAILLLLAACRPGRAADLWDDARYIHVSQVHAGMVGYGLSVFSGTRIDKFMVKVVDVVRNMVNPKCDVILISYTSDQLPHQGPVEGMSGSPIYLYADDDTQHSHPLLAGAYAYGFEWQTEPVAGVEPIEYMLKIPVGEKAPPAQASAGDIARPQWSLADVPALPGFTRNGAGFAVRGATAQHSGDLSPLATPLMASGLPPAVMRQTAPMFAACGFDLLQGGGAGGEAATQTTPITMEPGAVLVVPLLTGDMELSAAGTCTEVRGNRVFAFGHSFLSEGPIVLPMGTGTVATVIQDLHSSFKLASLGGICGTLTNDQSVGVGGTLGAGPPMAPIRIHVRYADGSLDQTYNFSAALHPQFTPLVAAAAVEGAIMAVKNLPQYHTLDFDLNLHFADKHTVRVADMDASADVSGIVQGVGLPIMAASSNPFENVPLQSLDGDIVIRSEARQAQITAVTLPKLKYEPGVTVDAYVASRLWHGGDVTLPIKFDLPTDLPDGQYQLVVSDAQRYFSDEMDAEPFRATARNVNEMFDVINDFESLRQNAVYVRLVRQPDGVAVGRTAMPRLPASFRTALLEAARSDLTSYVSSSVQIIPTDQVMDGAAEFTLTIQRQAHTESSKSPKPATQP